MNLSRNQVSGAIVILIVIGLFFYQNALYKRKFAYAQLFASEPTRSVTILSYGDSIGVFGDGNYALIFTISKIDLESLLKRQNFNKVDIESNSARWNLANCNWIVHNIATTRHVIDNSYSCYERVEFGHPSRLFFKDSEGVAILIGGKRRGLQ